MPREPIHSSIHALVRCHSLQELLDTARRSLSSPLILADLTYHVLAITPDNTIDDPRWTEINQERSLPLNIVNLGLYQSALRAGSPVLSTDSTGLPIVRCAVAQEDKLIGYLLSPGYGGPPTQEELDLIAILSDLCSLKMQKDLHYAEYPEDMLEFFISDLLNGTIREEQMILDRARFFKWNLKMPYRVLTIRSGGRNEAEDGGDYLELEKKRLALQRQFPDATAFLYGSQRVDCNAGADADGGDDLLERKCNGNCRQGIFADPRHKHGVHHIIKSLNKEGDHHGNAHGDQQPSDGHGSQLILFCTQIIVLRCESIKLSHYHSTFWREIAKRICSKIKGNSRIVRLEKVHKKYVSELCKMTLVQLEALGYYIDVSTPRV